jgi:ABC-type lipoprotein export system ATPase subunit
VGYNQWELLGFLKTKRRFMTARQIATDTDSTLTTINRKLNKMSKVHLDKKIKKVTMLSTNQRRAVAFFRYKK